MVRVDCVQGYIRTKYIYIHILVCDMFAVADIPLKKAVAGVRVGLLPELGFIVNPTVQQMEESKLDLIMAGTDSAVLMIEGYCDFLTEDQMLEVITILGLLPCT